MKALLDALHDPCVLDLNVKQHLPKQRAVKISK